MSIYDSAMDFSSQFDKWKWPMVGAIVLLILALVAFLIYSTNPLKPSELQASFSPNVLDTSKSPAIVSMTIHVNNTLKEDIQNITITVQAVDESIQLFPSSREIPVIEAGSFRELRGDSGFLIKPNSLQRPLPGRYTIQVTALVDGRAYANAEVQLEVK